MLNSHFIDRKIEAQRFNNLPKGGVRRDGWLQPLGKLKALHRMPVCEWKHIIWTQLGHRSSVKDKTPSLFKSAVLLEKSL